MDAKTTKGGGGGGNGLFGIKNTGIREQKTSLVSSNVLLLPGEEIA